MVILDNHVSRADWCYAGTDGNEFWHSGQYPEARWSEDWKGFVSRYAARRHVVGAELRNEVRATTGSVSNWGGGNPTTNWAAAAERPVTRCSRSTVTW